MPKQQKTIYECSKCGAQSSKWIGRCLECGSWGTLSEQFVGDGREKQKNMSVSAKIIDLEKIKSQNLTRMTTGIGELDRVVGGGIVPGSLLLLAGEPGIGKSTLLAQMTDAINKKKYGNIIYISGEESPIQVKDRLERLQCDVKGVQFISETDVEKIIPAILGGKPSYAKASEDKPADAKAMAGKPVLVVVDSIQTMYSSEVPSEAGGINQIRACTIKFLELAKENNIAVILTGHITKDGSAAGPKSLEHIVDAVLYLESQTGHDYRMLRASKNRFGSVDELGVFEMTGQGFKEVSNPSAVFLDDKVQSISGSVVGVIMEGTRPFLVEVQALVTKTVFGYPQRKSSGFDLNRLQVLTSVLTKRANINLTNQDVIINIAGGLKVSDPSLDLAVCLAISSSLLNQVVDRKTVVIGEVGLGGEIRKVGKLKERLKEAEKLGFKTAVIPDTVVSYKNLRIVKQGKLEGIVRNFL
ncbi:DNA repair protein RadA [Candidatus Parcubacteria bacterium]|nr:DNA repair protein RadA [Candidatus Parcubacteria bacterium]